MQTVLPSEFKRGMVRAEPRFAEQETNEYAAQQMTNITIASCQLGME